MSTISRLTGEGGGPRRARSRLVASTGPARAAAAGLSAGREQAARLVSGGLPADLLGGDLLGVLSDRLRAALAQPDPVPGVLPRPAATTRPGLPRAEPREALPGPLPGRAPVVRGPGGVVAERETGAGRPFTAPPGGRAAGVPGDATAGWAPAGRAVTGAEARPVTGPRWALEPPPGRPDRRTALERALAGYFRPGPEAPGPARPPAPMPGAPGPGRGAVPRTPAMAQPEAITPGSPAMTGEQVAERLRAFAGGEAHAPGERGDHHVPRGTGTETGDGPGTGGVDHGRSLTDLSEQMTDILRRQAVQHGIDVG
ncbi:hypothetical protein ACTI_85580 [Actinoplanes sp. OR16]|uniref:hypothetical protein n=1 Tax=Actinoplanes sp. OR16 TaxID=946334 RepID=UPI000F6B5F89|nr:hypothetical protein [Actinoplanes sp. OR16]BBH71873.1 hypothetical protein ACTI_85580 [Actinoplanes sp. OR16]